MRAKALKLAKSVAGVVLAAAVIVVAMLWLSRALDTGRVQPGSATSSATRPSGRVVAVERALRADHADLVGSVQAEVRSAISSRIVANILEIKVRSGDDVKEGQPLVVLDARDLNARLAQAKEGLRAVEAKRDLSKIELEKVERLASQNAASKFELEQWRAQHAANLAEVARAGQAVREAEVALSDAVLASPLSGVVIDRQAEPGDQASPGRSLLTVYDPSRMRLEASVREGFVGRMPVGSKVQVYIDALREWRDGTVQEVVPAADPQSRSFLAKIVIDNPKGLFPGLFGRVRLPLGEALRLEIPAEAVQHVGQLHLVRAAVGDRVERRAVRLGREHDGRVEILAGLSEGEQVLLGQ